MPKTIMVVDDCPMTRRLIGLYLKPDGYVVIQAVNGLDALEKLGGQPVDLIITDMNMPLMDGVALTLSLKEDRQLSSVPVLMLTTESAEAERRRGYEAGAATYLVKPVSQQQLSQEVRRLLETARA